MTEIQGNSISLIIFDEFEPTYIEIQKMETLNDRTKAFWQVSLKWNGRSKESMSTKKALALTVSILDFLPQYHPLYKRATALENSIIRYGTKAREKRLSSVKN